MISLTLTGKALLALLVVGWYLLRWPFDRRARRSRLTIDRRKGADTFRLAVSLTGLGIIPGIYIATGFPKFTSYSAHPALLVLGVLLGITALILFRLTHKALGKMWSVSLQLKQDHKLVTTGIYRRIRHPMYTAFWCLAFAQALLLPNYIAGFAGIAGFGYLFFSRVGPEEAMMREAFAEEYDLYCARTWRVMPYLY